MRQILLTLVVLIAASAWCESREVWQTGKVYSHVTCAADSSQTYALYLPSSYQQGKPTPVVFIFDPLARGAVPVDIGRQAAERYGYVLVASNNSRNGPSAPQFAAAEALWKDASERFSLDPKRVYFAGFSGGARFAVMFAARCGGCATGVMTSGAASTAALDLKSVAKFLYFGAVGREDFNFPEYLEFEPKLKDAGFSYHIERFDGGHEWAPADVWLEALKWFNLQAMKSGTLPRNDIFVNEAYAAAFARAAAQKNDLERYRMYALASTDFAGLTDISEAQKQASLLESSKTVKDLAKRERKETEDQYRLSGQISAALHALRIPDQRTDASQQLRDLFGNLRTMAKSNKDPQQQLVAKRVRMGAFIEAYESGEDFIRQRDFDNALLLYDTIIANATAAPGAHLQKSRIYLLKGDKKKALGEARLAVKDGIDNPDSFNDPEFSALKADPEFKALLDSLHPKKAE